MKPHKNVNVLKKHFPLSACSPPSHGQGMGWVHCLLRGSWGPLDDADCTEGVTENSPIPDCFNEILGIILEHHV